MLTKTLHFLVLTPVYICKRVLKQKTYLNLLMPLLGGFYFVKHRKIFPIYYPFVLIFLIAMISSLALGQWMSVVRCIQTILMVGFSHFLLHYLEKKDYFLILRNILIIFSLMFIYELIFTGPAVVSKPIIFGFTLPRYVGAVGESNFSGMVLSGIGLLYLVEKKYWLLLWTSIMLLLTASRGAWGAVLLGLLLLGEPLFSDKGWRITCKSILWLLFLLPFLLFAVELLFPDQWKMTLNTLSSHRYAIQLTYIKMAISYPFGTGFYNSFEKFTQYFPESSSIVQNGLFNLKGNPHQHNLYLQTLSELGIWGYCLLFLFLKNILNTALTVNRRLAFAFLCLLIGFTTLNAFSEFIFYFYFAYILRLTIEAGHRDKLCQVFKTVS